MKGKQKEDLESYLDKLFDITRCRCSIVLCESTLSECPEPKGCKSQVHIKCVCPLDRKLPKLDLRWIYSQRQKCGEKSDVQISLHDFKETDKQIKAEKRKFLYLLCNRVKDENYLNLTCVICLILIGCANI